MCFSVYGYIRYQIHAGVDFFSVRAALQYRNPSSYMLEVSLGAWELELIANTTFRNLAISVSLIIHGWLESLLQRVAG